MVKIRLKRIGAKKKPIYRIVVMDCHDRRDGKPIEEIGFYNPRAIPPVITIDEDSAIKWLKRGAQPTETTKSLLKKVSVYEKLKR
jgi:small subunit ribosomal protein S16